jgi:hypothetical protein
LLLFTTTPQALLDGVRKNHQVYLGYHDNSTQAETLAKVTHPIQAWYTTANKDVNGILQVDSFSTASVGDSAQLDVSLIMGSVTGLRGRDGRHSALYHVIIAVDPNKLLGHEIGTLADYISMLALSQVASLDTCQQLPSIINVLAERCSEGPSAITPNDIGYLRGLYKMNADGNLRSQEDEVAYRMKQSLDGR